MKNIIDYVKNTFEKKAFSDDGVHVFINHYKNLEKEIAQNTIKELEAIIEFDKGIEANRNFGLEPRGIFAVKHRIDELKKQYEL